MTSTTGPSITGQCMCGSASYEARSEAVMAAHCHCNNCRKSSATGHSSLLGVPRDAFSINGSLSNYSWRADSGHKLTKHFCPTCGCLVYTENDAWANLVILSPNLLDDPENFKPQIVVYASRAASWDQPDDSLPAFAEMPPAPA
ncbi:GFA family protein [Luteithermobacter gelatinilyticus]|uniref:GFA family protein n=1 Tax=Luteithermobacter gelatinilyticus TaxID=2582913 RepID=UPI0011058AAF|nr:GFA family protein [Luteithermobacter gelatinilyticus]